MSKYTVPKIWGPYFWFVMRCVAYNYSNSPDDTEYKQTLAFYSSLQHVLPCKSCKKSYSEDLIKYPLDQALKNKDSLVQWVETIYSETQKRTLYPENSHPIQEQKSQIKKQVKKVSGEPDSHRPAVKPLKHGVPNVENVPLTLLKSDSVKHNSHNSFVKIINKQVNKFIPSKNSIISQQKNKTIPQIKNTSSTLSNTNTITPSLNKPKNISNDTAKKIPKKISFDVSIKIGLSKPKNSTSADNIQKSVSNNGRISVPREKKKMTVTKRCNCGK